MIRSCAAAVAFVLAFLFASADASAQTRPINPTGIVFTPSPDHANITAYEADIKRADGTTAQTIAIGKPTPDTATGEITVSLNVMPVAFGTYTIVVRSIAGAVSGPPSSPTEQWDRAPGPPSKVRTK